MDTYFIVKTLHILSSAVLFGTGLGIAFFMFRSDHTGELSEKYFAVRNTVLADYVFTLPAVFLQPLSGAWLIWHIGYDWTDFWLLASYAIYLLAGACWLPVVWIQIELKKILAESLQTDQCLPKRYHRLFRAWFLLGWPAFGGLIVIFYLMAVKPTW